MTRARAGLLALACVAIALLSAALVGGEVLVGRDLLPQFYPRNEAFGRALRALTIPRWNPYCENGASWFGPRTGGVLYPGYALFALLPLARAMAAFVALHYLLAMEGARRLVGQERPGAPAFAAALVYGCGGFLTSQYWALPYLVSGALLPWALLGGLVAGRGRGALGAAGVALATGGMNLAGEPQGALAGAALAVALAAVTGRARGAAWAGAGVFAGALLAAPQLLSLLDELPRTNRAMQQFGDLRWHLAPAAHAADLVAPGLLGELAIGRGAYWGGAAWGGELPWCGVGLGALGLAAAATALARPRAWTAGERFAVGLALLGLLLASSTVSDALRLRFPAKWLVLPALGLAWLAGAGVARWRAARPGLVAPVTLAAVAALAALAGGAVVALGGPAGLGLEPAPIDPAAAEAEVRRAAARAALVAVAGLALWAARARLGPRRFVALALGLLTLDLLTAYRPGVETTRQPVLARPPLAAALAARARPPGSPARYEANPARLLQGAALPALEGLTPRDVHDRFLGALLQANAPYRFGVRAAIAFEAVEERARAALRADPRTWRLPLPPRLATLDVALLLLRRADLEALTPAEREGLPVVAMVTPDIALVENLACPDWAYCVSDAAPAASLPAAIDGLLEGPWAPWARVVLGPEGAAGATPGGPPAAARVEVRSFEAERIEVAVEAVAPCWLVVREAFHPDWRAEVDGAPVETARADVVFRAVRVPAGASVVTFVYAPWWWRPGVALAGLGALAVGALVVAGRSSPPPPPADRGGGGGGPWSGASGAA